MATPCPAGLLPAGRPRHTAAFTILEVMVATSVLAIATTSFLGGVFNTQQMQARVLAQGRVMEAIQRVIEDAQIMSYDDVRAHYTANPTFDVTGVDPLTKWSWTGDHWTARTGGPAPAVGSVTLGTAAGTKRIPMTIVCTWEDMQGPNVQTVNFIHTDRE